MNRTRSVAAPATTDNYKFSGPQTTHAPTGRGLTFDDVRTRLRRQLLSSGAPYEAPTRLIGLAIVEFLNRERGTVSATANQISPPPSADGSPRFSAWPSVETIAANTDLSVRSVQRHLKPLIAGVGQLFIRHLPPSAGAPLYVHRGGRVHATNGAVFEVVERPGALQLKKAAKQAPQATSAPTSAVRVAAPPASDVEALWTAYATAYGRKHGRAPKRLPSTDERRITASVVKAWERAEPSKPSPVPFAALVDAFLQSDDWRAKDDAFEKLSATGMVAKLAEDLDAAAASRMNEADPAERDRQFKIYGEFRYKDKRSPAQGSPVPFVDKARQQLAADPAAVAGSSVPACVRDAVEAWTAAGWTAQTKYGLADEFAEIRAGRSTWLDVKPGTWEFAVETWEFATAT